MSENVLHSASACLIVGAQNTATLSVIWVVILGEKIECKRPGRQQQGAGSLGRWGTPLPQGLPILQFFKMKV